MKTDLKIRNPHSEIRNRKVRLPTGEAVFIETHERFSVLPSREFAAEADRLFGEKTFYAKVDTTLPERKMEAWEKKTSNGDED